MTRRTELDALNEQLERSSKAARECGASDFFCELDDLAPARPHVWLVLIWVAVIAAIAMVLMSPAHATTPVKRTPGTEGSLTPPAAAPTANTNVLSNLNQSNTTVTAGATAGAMTGPVTAGNQLQLDGRQVTAPDVISYPTAPCRIAVGASGGWLGGALGFTTSVEDAACTLRETSRQLHNLGQRDAAVQVMCLNDDARRALEATGVECRVQKAAATNERVTP